MEAHAELRSLVSDLDLAQGAKDLLLATLLEEGEKIAPNSVMLIRLLDSLKSNRFLSLIPVEKTHLLENLVGAIRQGNKEWVSRVCYAVYEGTLPPRHTSSLLPEGMIGDLLRWVNKEKSEKVRECLWAILLRNDAGLANVAKVSDVAAGLCERDPINRNNVIRFFFDHFPPEEVVDSLYQYSMASGKRIPGIVFKRYADLIKDQLDQQQKKYILEKILSTAKLNDTEIVQIFSEYMNSLTRFDLIRLLSTPGGSFSRIAELKSKGRQMGLPFDHVSAAFAQNRPFRKRISLLMQELA
jgi:hypothetical protein